MRNRSDGVGEPIWFQLARNSPTACLHGDPHRGTCRCSSPRCSGTFLFIQSTKGPAPSFVEGRCVHIAES
jgi:hypothetical protein